MRISDWSSDVCSSDLSLLSSVDPLDPAGIALVIKERLRRLGVALEGAGETDMAVSPPPADPVARRIPYFCSGCPHNRSTKLPAGSMGMAGIGCHSMVTRSEEHTSELQSLMRTSYAVFCLKKKKYRQQILKL